MALGLTQPITEMSTRNISWGLRRPVRRADNLTIFMCRLSWNLGTSNSWKLLGLSRHVMGLLYLYLIFTMFLFMLHASPTSSLCQLGPCHQAVASPWERRGHQCMCWISSGGQAAGGSRLGEGPSSCSKFRNFSKGLTDPMDPIIFTDAILGS